MTHVGTTRQDIADLLGAIANGSIRTVMEVEYPFDKALDALEKTETRHARGKLVVRIGAAE